MTDTPTAYPPPQIVITYSGGRYHVDVAGKEWRVAAVGVDALCEAVRFWAADAEKETTP